MSIGGGISRPDYLASPAPVAQPVVKGTKKAYDINGAETEVPADKDLTRYLPDQNYSAGTQFSSIPNPNPGPGSMAATNTAKAAVQGIQSASGMVGGGGEGSYYTVDPTGKTSYNVTPNLIGQNTDAAKILEQQKINAATAAEDQKADLSSKAWHDKFNTIQPIMGENGSSSHVDMGGAAGDQEAAARAAAFGRAKDTAGANARASLSALFELTADRGQMGSSFEGAAAGNVLGGAGGQLGDVNREQLINDLNRSSAKRDMQYQGDITQRGQDLSSRNSLLGLLMASGGLY